MISRIFIHEQLLYFVGKTQFATGDSIRIFVLKTDSQLNPIDTVFIKPFVKNLLYFKVTDNFPDIGVIYVAESPSPTIPKAIYSISFSPEGEIYSHQTAPLEVNTAFLADVTDTPEGNIAVAGHYSIPGVPGTMPGCFMFNDSLTFDRFWVYPPTEEFGFQQYGIVIYSNTHFISCSTAYVSARAYLADTVIGYPQNYRYYIETMLADTAGHVFKSTVFGAGDTTLYPAFAKHLVATIDNSLFIVWTKDIESECFPYCNNISWIGVTYLNDSLEIEWERFFGGDAFYTSHIAEPAPGGGIVIAGTRYRYNDPGQPHEVILLSVTNEGIITGTAGNMPVEGRQAIVYPNPGDASLFVQTGRHIYQAEFTLYDINGRHLLSKTLNTDVTQIDIGFLPSGTYIYTIHNEKFSESGKWVKW